MREVLSVSVSKEFKRKVLRASKQYGVSQSDIVKNAVDKYLVSIEFYNLRNKLKHFVEKNGDFDLLNLKSCKNTEILYPREFFLKYLT